MENILGTDWMVFSRRRWKVVSSGDLEKKKQQRGPDRQWSHIVGTMMGGGWLDEPGSGLSPRGQPLRFMRPETLWRVAEFSRL